MNDIIKQLIARPLSGIVLNNFLDGETSVYLYSELKRFKNIDEAFNNNDSFIVLYRQSQYSGHWVCVIRNNNNIEFFDPYGYFFFNDKWNSNKTNKALGQDKPQLKRLFKDSTYELHYNDFIFQDLNPQVATCGRHCVIRILFKELNIQQYKKVFEDLASQHGNPDRIVTILTYDIDK